MSCYIPSSPQVSVDWDTAVGDRETQEGQCCTHTSVQWRREGKKRRKELVWWQSHNLFALFERGKKKVLTHSCKGILYLHRYAAAITLVQYLDFGREFLKSYLNSLESPRKPKKNPENITEEIREKEAEKIVLRTECYKSHSIFPIDQENIETGTRQNKLEQNM